LRGFTVAARAERTSGERETLERLRDDEAALEREIAAARAEAAATVEAARREAEAIVAAARRSAASEREALRAQAAAEAEAARATADEEVRAVIDALAGRARTNRERALARALEVVLGRAP
jgi:F0F1-type ATP synthase membrane subunit b/b'